MDGWMMQKPPGRYMAEERSWMMEGWRGGSWNQISSSSSRRSGWFLLRLSPSHLCPCRSSEAQKLPYYASYGPARLAIHSLCTSHYLDLVITFIICINVITMSLEHYSQPQVGGWLDGWSSCCSGSTHISVNLLILNVTSWFIL